MKSEQIYERVCPICGKQFTTHKKRVKYCCSECSAKAKKLYNVEWVREHYKNDPEFRAYRHRYTALSNKRIYDRERRERFMKIANELVGMDDVDKIADYLEERVVGIRKDV